MNSPQRKRFIVSGKKPMLECRFVRGTGFVRFEDSKPEDYLSIVISFLRNRYHSRKIPTAVDFEIDETFCFEFEGIESNFMTLLLKLKQPLNITILRH